MSIQGRWSPGWLSEGHFISYKDERKTRYAVVTRWEFAHIEYTWPELILPTYSSGPYTIEDLEVTAERTQLYQFIFGILGDVYIYVHLPVEVDRHGLAKRPKATATLREVGHYTQDMSPYERPSWITEHFLIRPIATFVAFSAYNNKTVTQMPKLNFYVNKCELEYIGYEEDGNLYPSKTIYRETLDKLYRKVIPHRPITIRAVRAPVEAP